MEIERREVRGAFWIAFAVGVSVAAITGPAHAELATKYPKAAGAALYVHKAFGNRLWCAGLVAVGVALFVVEHVLNRRGSAVEEGVS